MDFRKTVNSDLLKDFQGNIYKIVDGNVISSPDYRAWGLSNIPWATPRYSDYNIFSEKNFENHAKTHPVKIFNYEQLLSSIFTKIPDKQSTSGGFLDSNCKAAYERSRNQEDSGYTEINELSGSDNSSSPGIKQLSLSDNSSTSDSETVNGDLFERTTERKPKDTVHPQSEISQSLTPVANTGNGNVFQQISEIVPKNTVSNITMSLIVSSKYHSHFIGNKGEKIKQLNDATGCRIKFPNNKNLIHKSNTVIVTSNMVGVEEARTYLRSKTPITVSFPIPYMSVDESRIVEKSKKFVGIQRAFKIKAGFYCNALNHVTYVRVQGNDTCELEIVRAIHKLMDWFVPGEDVACQIKMFIRPAEQKEVFDNVTDTMRNIMNYTNTKIIRLELNPFVEEKEKNAIKIEGSVENLFKAKQLIMALLPITVKLQLPSNEFDKAKMEELKNFLCLDVKLNRNGENCAVIITCMEFFIGSLYKAISHLLNYGIVPEYNDNNEFTQQFFLKYCMPPNYQRKLEYASSLAI